MKKAKRDGIYIVGAGFAGRSIAREIREKGVLGRVVAFLDDDPTKIGTRLDGLPVLGPIERVEGFLATTPATEALIALPSTSRERLKEVYCALSRADFARIRILPDVSQIVDGDAHLVQTREVDADDLLARSPVAINLKESLDYLRGKRVLITGAGGSIGSELARQLLHGGAARLYLFDHEENSIYEIDKELKLLQAEGVGEQATVVPVLGDLQDRDYVRFIMRRLRADVVFHCAAHKHVPMCEHNPVETIKNNTFGTRNLVDAAIEVGTPRFVFVSTDKAVRPSSVYGASKMLAEEIVLRKRPGRGDFMVVRFGNVLGSRGSIVPLFKKQILNGGPVTITHPEMSRFFMTIPEASSLVLKAGGVGKGGDLYILDMGEPILIRELAETMIRFFGFVPEREIPLRYVGLRPGEKLHETLWDSDEQPVPTGFPRINRLPREERFNGSFDRLLSALHAVCFFDPERPEPYRNRRELRRILHAYIPSVNHVDDEPEY